MRPDINRARSPDAPACTQIKPSWQKHTCTRVQRENPVKSRTRTWRSGSQQIRITSATDVFVTLQFYPPPSQNTKTKFLFLECEDMSMQHKQNWRANHKLPERNPVYVNKDSPLIVNSNTTEVFNHTHEWRRNMSKSAKSMKRRRGDTSYLPHLTRFSMLPPVGEVNLKWVPH